MVSITIVITGGDITPSLYLATKEFFELHAQAFYFGTERGNIEENLHLQGTAKIMAVSPICLKNAIRKHYVDRNITETIHIVVKMLRGV